MTLYDTALACAEDAIKDLKGSSVEKRKAHLHADVKEFTRRFGPVQYIEDHAETYKIILPELEGILREKYEQRNAPLPFTLEEAWTDFLQYPSFYPKQEFTDYCTQLGLGDRDELIALERGTFTLDGAQSRVTAEVVARHPMSYLGGITAAMLTAHEGGGVLLSMLMGLGVVGTMGKFCPYRIPIEVHDPFTALGQDLSQRATKTLWNINRCDYFDWAQTPR